MKFKLESSFQPNGDQPQAIKKLTTGLRKHFPHQTLLGVTGSGKTFTMSGIIEQVQRPTLVISHNKTLAAQLATEFRQFFPNNAVHYFVSFYDYYQPEAYIPRSDTYIEKDTSLNEEIDRLRHGATQSLLSRSDVIIVASVSCIYGLGSPSAYQAEAKRVQVGDHLTRQSLLRRLIKMQFERNDIDFFRGTFRVRGDVVEIYPASSDHDVLRVEFFGDEIERLAWVDALTGEPAAGMETNPREAWIYPASHYMTQGDSLQPILDVIEQDMVKHVEQLKRMGKLVEAQRLQQRTRYDLEMLQQTGFVPGIENYSRYFDGRKPGTPPYTLIDFFPKDFLVFIDESHMTIPQIQGMYHGDRSRKMTLVDYGFRLPAAMDNRPLKFEEFAQKTSRVIYVSATPAAYEFSISKQVVQQIIRPTGLLDPEIDVRSTRHQIDDLIAEIDERVKKKQRVLVTTLTKRMSEELADYFKEHGIQGCYLHSDVDTMERLEILRDLRLGVYDVLVGINLLREGLDLPEVSLVAILDADKEGYLRSETALVQTMGRASRHAEGKVILYADRLTKSMKNAIEITRKRRVLQEEYNREHGITPTTILKKVSEHRLAGAKLPEESDATLPSFGQYVHGIGEQERRHLIAEITQKMNIASRNLEFEKAAQYRDQLIALKRKQKTG